MVGKILMFILPYELSAGIIWGIKIGVTCVEKLKLMVHVIERITWQASYTPNSSQYIFKFWKFGYSEEDYDYSCN